MFTVFSPCSCPIGLNTKEACWGMWMMDARFAAGVATGLGLTVLGVVGFGGGAFAQNYPTGAYTPGPAYRGAPPIMPNDDDDLVPLPAPGPYGRPSGAPYNQYDPRDSRPPGAIQREALPAPGLAPAPYGAYADSPPPRRYGYGAWE